jgi:hypothetical protein
MIWPVIGEVAGLGQAGVVDRGERISLENCRREETSGPSDVMAVSAATSQWALSIYGLDRPTREHGGVQPGQAVARHQGR